MVPPYPYRVICEATTERECRYLSTWYPTLVAAQVAQDQYLCEDWDSVELRCLDPRPGVSVTGKQLLAVGGRMRRRGRGRGRVTTKEGR